jgi:PIN domain nuclease of toxin-antitoxin system
VIICFLGLLLLMGVSALLSSNNHDKLPTATDLAADFSDQVEREGFQLLAMSAEHGIRAGLLPGPHKDPFDRMLIAQAQAENMPIISNEVSFESYGVRRLW